MGEGEASREEGDDGGNHGYKDGGWRDGDVQRGPGRMNSRVMESSRKTDYLQWMRALLLWLGVSAGSSPLCLRLPPLQSPPMSRRSYVHPRLKEREENAGRSLRSVSLPSPVSPQPPLSVLPQPVVFQSIGSQPRSHRACALPGL